MNKLTKDNKSFLDKFKIECHTNPTIHADIIHRIDHMDEELEELTKAVEDGDKEEVIDAIIDIVYIAIGTATMCGFNFDAHWDEVHNANMNRILVKTDGYKFGVKKPDDWVGPNHGDLL